MRNYLELLYEAGQQDFKRVVSGFLLDARPKGEGVRAAIFNDRLNRFEDGEVFTTSRVVGTFQEAGYTLLLTENGSCYVIVSHLMFIEDVVGGVPQTMILRAS
ncbi:MULTISPECIES: hypothetical protein [Pseudomonas syringae group]|uniref:hypothetical protein n=1 Tax=Pseudomonas syringae group TaxID=136849 RepID=UPI0013037B61|nr:MULTISPECIES: hypothetical protein [Pseudomonas syringae group]MCF5199906.1 hypothetical protein [Pseudomonas syringae]MCF5209291.1 hypothetical protein [Pseudomonas syringae]MCF5214964.1 hypothetical protein [Pseudomonas syringae]MCF5220678.1 hypothetical protein [Pseudomonas syringae]MCF5266652.1 hypothetical protein [Pseudomonas syringae]